jgi:hypothetical protein
VGSEAEPIGVRTPARAGGAGAQPPEGRCRGIPKLRKSVPRLPSAAKFGGADAARAERSIPDGGVKKAATRVQPRITRRHLPRDGPAASAGAAARRRPSGNERAAGRRRRTRAAAAPSRRGGPIAAAGAVPPVDRQGASDRLGFAKKLDFSRRSVSFLPSQHGAAELAMALGWPVCGVSRPARRLRDGRCTARARGGSRVRFAPPCVPSVSVAHSGRRFARRARPRRREGRTGGESGAARALHCSLTTAPHAVGMRVSEETAE